MIKLFLNNMLCWLFPLLAFTQMEQINNLDSIGQKTGLWIEVDTALIIANRDTINYIRCEGEYINGKRVGTWHCYNSETESLYQKIDYQWNDEILKITEFYSSGNIRSKYLELEISDTLSLKETYFESGNLKSISLMLRDNSPGYSIQLSDSGTVLFLGIVTSDQNLHVLEYQRDGSLYKRTKQKN